MCMLADAADRVIEYDQLELRDVQLAWATTVHKAQGGESPIVVLLLSHDHGRMLNRRLLYTGRHGCTWADALIVRHADVDIMFW